MWWHVEFFMYLSGEADSIAFWDCFSVLSSLPILWTQYFENELNDFDATGKNGPRGKGKRWSTMGSRGHTRLELDLEICQKQRSRPVRFGWVALSFQHKGACIDGLCLSSTLSRVAQIFLYFICVFFSVTVIIKALYIPVFNSLVLTLYAVSQTVRVLQQHINYDYTLSCKTGR